MSEPWPEFDPTALLELLVRRGVDFVVIGGIAAVLHGSPRNTRDLDVCFATDEGNFEALGNALLDLDATLRGVSDNVPFVADAATLRKVELLTLSTSRGPLDVMVRPAGAPAFNRLRRAAERQDLGAFSVLVASLEDLIAMKRASGRPKDLVDIEELEQIRRLRRKVKPPEA